MEKKTIVLISVGSLVVLTGGYFAWKALTKPKVAAPVITYTAPTPVAQTKLQEVAGKANAVIDKAKTIFSAFSSADGEYQNADGSTTTFSYGLPFDLRNPHTNSI